MKAPQDPIVKEVLLHFPDAELIYLFGSHRTPYEKPSSDLDIAVLLTYSLGALECFTVQEKISLSLNRDVDLITLREASTVMRFEIITKGRLLYKKNENARVAFEGLAVSMYLRFEDERRATLEQFIAQRKT